MFADDGALECPFAPDGGMYRVAGKDYLAAYLASIKDVLGSDSMMLATHRASGTTILEYEGTARNLRNDAIYPQRYLTVVQVRDGRLSPFREYWNPLPLLGAFGDDFLDACGYPKRLSHQSANGGQSPTAVATAPRRACFRASCKSCQCSSARLRRVGATSRRSRAKKGRFVALNEVRPLPKSRFFHFAKCWRR